MLYTEKNDFLMLFVRGLFFLLILTRYRDRTLNIVYFSITRTGHPRNVPYPYSFIAQRSQPLTIRNSLTVCNCSLNHRYSMVNFIFLRIMYSMRNFFLILTIILKQIKLTSTKLYFIVGTNLYLSH